MTCIRDEPRVVGGGRTLCGTACEFLADEDTKGKPAGAIVEASRGTRIRTQATTVVHPRAESVRGFRRMLSVDTMTLPDRGA